MMHAVVGFLVLATVANCVRGQSKLCEMKISANETKQFNLSETLSCAEGYVPLNNDTTVCRQGGQWSSDNECVANVTTSTTTSPVTITKTPQLASSPRVQMVTTTTVAREREKTKQTATAEESSSTEGPAGQVAGKAGQSVQNTQSNGQGETAATTASIQSNAGETAVQATSGSTDKNSKTCTWFGTAQTQIICIVEVVAIVLAVLLLLLLLICCCLCKGKRKNQAFSGDDIRADA